MGSCSLWGRDIIIWPICIPNMIVKIKGYLPGKYVSTQMKGKRKMVTVEWTNLQRPYHHGYWKTIFP